MRPRCILIVNRRRSRATYSKCLSPTYSAHNYTQQVPALYFSNYSASLELVDELSLVRPDQSYRADKDATCQEVLDDDLAVYMVYTTEEGDDRFVTPHVFTPRRTQHAVRSYDITGSTCWRLTCTVCCTI